MSSASVSGAHSGSVSTPRRWGNWRERRFATLLMSPSLIVISLIALFPILYTLLLSMYSYEMVSPLPARFIGLENYRKLLFEDSRFWHAVLITLIMVVFGITLQLLLGFGCALLLNREFRGRNALVSTILIPTTLAPVVVGFVWRMLLDDRFGPINFFLKSLGLPAMPWFASPVAAVIGIILANTWEWFPFMMMVLLAGLHSIPAELGEAAEVDGASPWQVFWRVTVPVLRPIIMVLILIRAIEDFKLFDIIVVMTNGGPGIATESMNMYAYQRGFNFFSIGYASAISVVQLVMVLVLVRVLFSRLSRMR
ncbi:MAG: sugar ABC transporter permease [Anaerolineae bacterium]|nr:sugar ABC transporter permease [Anaerolineae bacterium]